MLDFEFSADQLMLRDSVRRFLADRAGLDELVRPVIDREHPDLAPVWRGLATLGVTGLLVPERHGGAGRGLVDAAVALEELGRGAAPLPFAETAIAAASLLGAVDAADDTGDVANALAALAAGDRRVTLALFDPGRRYDWRRPETVVDGGGLHGTKIAVPFAAECDAVIVVARDDGGLAPWLVDLGAPGVEITVEAALDRTRPTGTCTFSGAIGARLGVGDQHAAIATAVDRLGVAHALDAVGAASRALELSVEYAGQREQFGAPIGSFQAVQHLCADMLQAVELARAGAYYACWAADAADPAEAHRAALLAQAWVADELGAVGASAIQVFGGIGFTWEHDIHIFYKRVLSTSLALGTGDDHLRELADTVLS